MDPITYQPEWFLEAANLIEDNVGTHTAPFLETIIFFQLLCCLHLLITSQPSNWKYLPSPFLSWKLSYYWSLLWSGIGSRLLKNSRKPHFWVFHFWTGFSKFPPSFFFQNNAITFFSTFKNARDVSNPAPISYVLPKKTVETNRTVTPCEFFSETNHPFLQTHNHHLPTQQLKQTQGVPGPLKLTVPNRPWEIGRNQLPKRKETNHLNQPGKNMACLFLVFGFLNEHHDSFLEWSLPVVSTCTVDNNPVKRRDDWNSGWMMIRVSLLSKMYQNVCFREGGWGGR